MVQQVDTFGWGSQVLGWDLDVEIVREAVDAQDHLWNKKQSPACRYQKTKEVEPEETRTLECRPVVE